MDEQHQHNTPHNSIEGRTGHLADARERPMVDVEIDVDDQVYAAFCSTCGALGLVPEEVVCQGLTWMAEHPDEALACLRREIEREGMALPPEPEST